MSIDSENLTNNKKKYIELCLKEPSICIFSQPYWLDAVCGEMNWDVILYEKGDNIIGALPYYFICSMGKINIMQPVLTPSMGIWIKYPTEQKYERKLSHEMEVTERLIEDFEKLPIRAYAQSFSVKVTNWLPFYWHNYRQTTYYSYRIPDISDVEKVVVDFSANKRKNIKKAQTENLVIKFDLSAKMFYENHQITLEKQGGKISYSFKLFEKIYNVAYDNNAGRVIYAEDIDGNIHAALFIVWDKESAYDLISTIDPDFRNGGASTLLVLEMIKYLSGKVPAFDFEGSMIKGVENSFRHFGAIQFPYFNITKDFGNKYEIVFDKIIRKINKMLKNEKL